MKRTTLANSALPCYTKEEERFHFLSHLMGGVLSLAALTTVVARAAWHREEPRVLGAVIYGFCQFFLYICSTLYHGLPPGKAKKIFRVADHAAIYLLIAGTYAPLALGPLRMYDADAARLLLIVVWSLCAVSVVFTCVDMIRFRVLSMICYIGMGWCAVLWIKPLLAAAGLQTMLWVLGGGLFYTLGAVFYGLGKRKKWAHASFHVLALLGSALHFVAILRVL